MNKKEGGNGMKICFELVDDSDYHYSEELHPEDIRDIVLDAICDGFKIPTEAIKKLTVEE